MIDIQPQVTLTKSTVQDPSRSRVPLHELQMLTQSVTNREYVHAYAPISVSINSLLIINFIHNLLLSAFHRHLLCRAHVYILVYTR